jgi:hypothetical protein
MIQSPTLLKKLLRSSNIRPPDLYLSLVMGCAAGASASVWKYAMWAWTRSLIHLFTGVNPRRVRVVFPLSISELIECDFSWSFSWGGGWGKSFQVKIMDVNG